ncbi:TlpA disulfide reductase family protein [Pseudoalteromonas luteoviolacea]|uniref:Thioredoxin domain-containing protein n=1 Tax=Pseudoalteromonas luteoviolacea H33 TaxID=1365251 RepID=A0A167CIR0_9GAMM|nr:TlpA disulfide reductase family protein [Pseudoalteromonas luteoviolacea]KZN47707.1 hypothetical protein N476_23170 [Pseudoalteromonas luteoviolacea H33]KZN75742.1 hypothetical protein N477_17495 [Pseudoalteromonas luteoviolacea H33-S]MBQ4879161.1 redoxin family protein [Pseudoalteromonas luteoviolacea]MBQ4908221.1 redoxin family protein [Pseudoalteromonas luteoviolacea]
MLKRSLILFILFFTATANANIEHISADQVLGLNQHEAPIYRSSTTPTIVTFWASWCPYCKQLLPLLEGLQRKLGHDKVSVIVVNTREEGSLSQTKRTYKSLLKQFEKRGLQVTFVFDKKHTFYKKLKKPGLPFTLVINQQGQVTYAQAGYSERTAQPMLKAIEKVLTGNT